MSIQDLLALFYAGDGLVVLPKSARLQGAFNALMGLFDWVGLHTNNGKAVSISCQLCHNPYA